MAFIGLLLVMGLIFVILVCMGVFPIIIGTHLIHYTEIKPPRLLRPLGIGFPVLWSTLVVFLDAMRLI